MSNVYVVQKQMRYDSDKGISVPRFPTIALAEKFGSLVYCLNPNEHPFEPESVVGNLHEALKDFNQDDYLILVGNPVILGLATAIASHYNSGNVTFLQWSNRSNDYIPIITRMF